jgi:tetratricopeptide (TPR) repeat protein
MIKRSTYSLLILGIVLIWSCAPTKNTAMRRSYHNMVSRYNIYYNGRDALRQGQLQLQQNHKDDYTGILDLLQYAGENEVTSVIPMMDRASEKGSKLILKHSMNFGGNEYNRWVDDAYLLIGKARFFKRDYIGANEMFDFVSKRFTKSPIRYEALLWMAKSHLYAGKLSRCDALFGMIEPHISKGETTKWVEKNFYIIKAQYLIRSGNLEEASTCLDKALTMKQPRMKKIRITFVAGQVNQKLGRNEKALEYYQSCIKMNPPYDIAFHAKIFSAECYDAGMGGGNAILDELFKMLKDSKNKDYFDEIYYALANIELKKDNTEKGIEYLKLSVSSSVNNDLQKGLSFYKLATLHFEMKKYKESKMFYDSTLAFLPKKYENYPVIEEKAKILTGLIDNLYTIELEDSLQRLANMSEKERFAVIDKIIADLIKEEELEKQRERERQHAAMQQKDPNQQITQAPGSSWYFYNPSAVNYGMNEFVRMWGERKLEDLWRLADKEVSVFSEFNDPENPNDPETNDSVAKAKNPKDRAYYLRDIPDTPEKIAKSNEKIKMAFYKAGSIYKDELKDFIPATELFEALLQRFPINEFELQTYYNLYVLYKNLNNSSGENKYKNLILQKYPDSDFAKIITDPDYFKKIAQQSDEVKSYYKQTWQLYQDGMYQSVILFADSAIEKYNDPQLLPKFEYLKAISLAKTQGVDSMIVQLEHIVTNYPESDIRPLAENVLNYYREPGSNETSETIEGDKETTTSAPLYKPTPDSYHLFVLIVDVITADMNSIKALMSDHNTQYFSTKNLTVSSLFLNDKRHVLTVSRFNNQADAENYYKIFTGNTSLLDGIGSTNPVYFVISTDNYPAFYKDKDEEAYQDFFRRYYLSK